MKYAIALVLIGCGSGFSATTPPGSDSGPDAQSTVQGMTGGSGGRTGTGGETGGRANTGGVQSSGGTVNTGGVQTGGLPGTGGSGGTVSSGGTSSGGTPSTGGAPSTGGLPGTGGTTCDPVACPPLQDGTSCPGSFAAPTATSCCTSGSCGCWGEGGMQAGQPEVDVCYPANTCTPSGANDNFCPATTVYMFTCPGVGSPDPSCQLFGVASYGRPYFCCPKPSYPPGGSGGSGGAVGSGGAPSTGGASTGGAPSCSQPGNFCGSGCCPGSTCLLNGTCSACFPVGSRCNTQAQCCSGTCSTGICVP